MTNAHETQCKVKTLKTGTEEINQWKKIKTQSLSLSTSVPGAETRDADKRGKTAWLLLSVSLLVSKNSAQSISQLLSSDWRRNWFVRTDFNMCLKFRSVGIGIITPLAVNDRKKIFQTILCQSTGEKEFEFILFTHLLPKHLKSSNVHNQPEIQGRFLLAFDEELNVRQQCFWLLPKMSDVRNLHQVHVGVFLVHELTVN